jgi:hypothetical protein
MGLRRPRNHGAPSQLRRDTYKTKWIKSLIADGFRYEILVLEICDSAESLNAAEIRWIAIGRAALGRQFTNCTEGGEGTVGRKLSEEAVQRIRSASTGRKHTPEARAKMSKARAGRKLSVEHIANIRLAQKGIKRHPLTAEHREKLSKSGKGKQSVEHKLQLGMRLALLNKSRRGVPLSEEHRAKIAKNGKGKHTISDEHRVKILAGLRRKKMENA